MEFTLISNDIPAAIVSLAQFFYFCMFNDRRTSFLRSAGVGVHSPGGIHISFAVTPKATEHPADIHDGTFVFDVLRRH